MKEKRKLVQALCQSVSAKMAISALDINRSSYYYRPKERHRKKTCKPLDARLVTILLELKGLELTLGYRKTGAYIKAKYGTVNNHEKMNRHMKALKMLQPKIVKKPKKKKQETVLED